MINSIKISRQSPKFFIFYYFCRTYNTLSPFWPHNSFVIKCHGGEKGVKKWSNLCYIIYKWPLRTDLSSRPGSSVPDTFLLVDRAGKKGQLNSVYLPIIIRMHMVGSRGLVQLGGLIPCLVTVSPLRLRLVNLFYSLKVLLKSK